VSVNWQLQALIDGVYTTLPSLAEPARITRGVLPYGSWPRATEFEFVINNDSLDYDPSRPAALLYGKAGRNTRVRISPNAGANRVYGEATWRPERTLEHKPGQGFGKASVYVTGNGLLNRLALWEDVVRSPMYSTISARAASIGHWDLEGGNGATRLSNTRPGGVGGTLTGVTMGEDEAPLGAASSARIADGSRMAGTFANASTSAGWQVSWSFQAKSLPTSPGVFFEFFRFTTANGYKYVFLCSPTSFWMHVEDSTAAVLADEIFTFGSGATPTNWMTMRLAVEQIGGNVSWNWAWYMQEMSIFYVPVGTFAGVVSRPTFWFQEGNAVTADWHFSHIFGVTGLTDDLMSTLSRQVFNGYKGERALTRFFRVLLALGITRYGIGTEAESAPMGAQKPATVIDILKEIRATEDGDISDERLDIALTMRTRRNTATITPAIALAATDLSGYVKVIGSEGVANRVTAKNVDGSEVTLSLSSGPMSTLPPPNGVGEKRQQIDVSVDDETAQLEDIANWHLAKGTIEGPRYSSISVDLIANPGISGTAGNVREGDLITVTGLEPDLLRLLVVGIEQTGSATSWDITWLCEPYDVYNTGIWDDASFIWGARTSRLNGAHTAGDVTLDLTTDDPADVWSTAFTGDLIIAGERVTVTAMGAASGSGPYLQTATVVRAVNSIVKAQLDQASVMLFDNKRWGL
jgi:hypothetical protein